jgi:hypothetical protein
MCLERYNKITYSIMEENDVLEHIIDKKRNFYNIYLMCKLLENYVIETFRVNEISWVCKEERHSSSGIADAVYARIITKWSLFEHIFERTPHEEPLQELSDKTDMYKKKP